MKKSNQIRINDKELHAIYKLLCKKIVSFVDHYADDGTPVYVYSGENEIYMNLYHKMMRECIKRDFLKGVS